MISEASEGRDLILNFNKLESSRDMLAYRAQTMVIAVYGQS